MVVNSTNYLLVRYVPGVAGADRHEPGPQGMNGELRSGMGVGLLHRRCEVRLNGARRDPKRVRYLRARASVNDKLEHLPLARRQRRDLYRIVHLPGTLAARAQRIQGGM